MIGSLRTLLCIPVCAVALMAQGPDTQTPTGAGTTAPGGSVGANPNPGGLSRTPPPNRGIQDQNQDNTIQRTIFISGKVMTDDGSPLPPNIAVQRLCGGASPQTMAFTDSKGHFNFQWDRPNSAFADASESGFDGALGSARNSRSSGGINGGSGLSGMGDRIQNCEVLVNVVGYRSNPIQLFNHGSLDNPEIGSIILHRMSNVEGTSVSATGFAAPKDAKKAYEKGLQTMLKNKPDEAAKEFERAVQLYPKYADAWYNLGKVRIRLKQAEPAREALEKALEADGKLVGPWFELGLLSASEQKWEDTEKYMDKTTHLDPVDFPQAWYIHAVAAFNLGKLEAAEKSAREAQKLDARHVNPRADYLLAIVLVERRDYSEAVAQFKAYLKAVPNAPDASQIQAQVEEISKFISGKGPGK